LVFIEAEQMSELLKH